MADGFPQCKVTRAFSAQTAHGLMFLQCNIPRFGVQLVRCRIEVGDGAEFMAFFGAKHGGRAYGKGKHAAGLHAAVHAVGGQAHGNGRALFQSFTRKNLHKIGRLFKGTQFTIHLQTHTADNSITAHNSFAVHGAAFGRTEFAGGVQQVEVIGIGQLGIFEHGEIIH